MFGKVLSSVIIIVVVYILGIFLAPVLTDSIGEKLGIASVHTTIRNFKGGVDATSDTLLQIRDASGAISGVRDVVNKANETINQTSETISSIRQTGEQKMQQFQKTADSIKKANDAITEVQNNVSELTSLTGATSTGAKQ